MLHQHIAPPPGAMQHFNRDARFRRLVSLFARDEIEAAVDCLIATLDAFEGDPDVEDATGNEDAFEEHLVFGRDRGPGCPIADTDKGVDDDGEGIDDDREGETLPECHTQGIKGIPDDDHEEGPTERAIRRPYINRIRRYRCDKVMRPGGYGNAAFPDYYLHGRPLPVLGLGRGR